MQKNSWLLFLTVLSSQLVNSQAILPQESKVIKYTDGVASWNADSLGNHRAVIRYNGSGNIARVIIPWRRRDLSPEKKRIIVQDAKTGKRVMNTVKVNSNRESGELYFEPLSGKGIYYVYYLPYRNEGRSNYPKGVYLKPDTTATVEWATHVNAQSPINGQASSGGSRAAPTSIPVNCTVEEFQSIDAFNSFYPMEVIATAKETKDLKAKFPGRSFLIFPEDRLHSIRMRTDLPVRWIGQGANPVFRGEAAKGEYFAYQLGIYALRDLEDLQLVFSDLKGADGKVIAAENISCINTTGIGYDGQPFLKKVTVPKNQVQALWCGINIPAIAETGSYSGNVTVLAKGVKQERVVIRINVGATLLKDGGAGEPAKMTRLKWLNSTMAQENTVIAPYTPLTIQGDSLINLLGRQVQLNQQGFPQQIQTFFTPEMTEIGTTPQNILAENIHFHFTRQADGKDVRLKSEGLTFTKREPGTVQWKAANTADELRMDLTATLEFDGFLSYRVKVTALQDVELKEITMHIPFKKEVAKYMMGLGLKGGYRPDSLYQWKWDVASKNQDGAWIGNTNAGLQYSLRDEKYSRPLNTNFYLQKPLLLPSSWGNDGKGGIGIGIKGSSMLANNYSGSRKMKKGDTLFYNFTLLITPFHPINTDFQWATRFYHRYNNLDTIKAKGATVINIHHATPINPWINYPFIEWKKMKGYIDTAHTLGLKVKIYNTVRELSNHAYETFAMRSLGSEVYSGGAGGGYSWLQEHIGDDYIAAWFVPEIRDAALVNSGMNRWHNYYVEGMNWLTQNVGIDGIYLDDVAFDRITMKRIKRVLTQDGHPGIIDLHSANQYNKHDGFNNSGNLYMEHFPYLNRLWFGEYFDYEKNGPDFFLTEVSGIPFGLMGEMLEGGGNPWRGLIYGMTNRMPWTENADPGPIWKIWDDFGMQGTKMLGYWSPSCPVKTSIERILATVYQKKNALLVSLASWAEEDTTVRLNIDWKQAGLDPATVSIEALEMKNFQPARKFRADEPIPIQKGKGWLLIIK
ncbi:glycoside hydrolase domain-containing protein [Flavitalea flava]